MHVYNTVFQLKIVNTDSIWLWKKTPIIPIHLENPIIKSKDIKHIFSIKHAEVVNR